MEGAREFAELFKTGQHDRLYFVSGTHARGRTFSIYVLPAGEKAIPNGENNPPLNNDAVEVYGVVSGNPGWTESYGWIYHGKWKEDFEALVKKALERKVVENLAETERRQKVTEERTVRNLKLLSDYV